jgi:hypothetical protein
VSAGATLRSPDISAQTISYSAVDQATVRIFAFDTVRMLRAKDRRGRIYRLAVPDCGHGSGVMIDEGVVLTASHVVASARHVVLKVHGSTQAHLARVILSRLKDDFAVLQTTARTPTLSLPAGPLKLEVRQRVHAIGYPIDAERLTAQSSTGTVSGITNDGLLQLAMAVNPGNSGGPLVDDQERVLGIVVAKGNLEAGVEGMAFAVPIERIAPAVPKALNSERRRQALAELSSDPRGKDRVAALIAKVVERAGAGGMFREVTRPTSKDRVIQTYLNAALEAESSVTPTTLELGAAYYWNAANWAQYNGRKGHEELRARAVAMCRTAVKREPDLATHSEFARFITGGSEGAQGGDFAAAGAPRAVRKNSK